MYTITVEKEIFTYEDLLINEDLKEKVLNNLYDINVHYEWWDYVYDDAERIGIKITSFDEHNITGHAIEDFATVKRNILNDHGKDTDTYQCVKVFDLRKGIEEGEEMVYQLLECYRIMLSNEYEYLTSEKVILETIESNEYEFDANGNIV